MDITGRFRSRPVEGQFIRYDGSGTDQIAAFARSQYEGTDEHGHPLVRGLDGDLQALRPGWVLTRAAGADGAGILSAPAWDTWAEEIP